MRPETSTEALRRPARPSRVARVFLGALFLLLVCYTGTLVGAFSALPHFITIVVTVALCVSGSLWPASRKPGALNYLATYWQRCQRLPAPLLLFLAAWLACDGLAARSSALPFLSEEVFGSHLWTILIAALIYGYASRSFACACNVTAGILVALDAAIAFGAWQYLNYWTNPARDTSFHAQHFTVTSFLNDTNQFGHYVAFLLPLALWDAMLNARGEEPNLATTARVDLQRPARSLWNGWRSIRPGILWALGVATTSRSCWLSATLGVLLLLALWSHLHRRGENRGALKMNFAGPLRMSLIVGAVLTLGIGIQQSAWLHERLQSTIAPTNFGNTGRGVIWSNALRMAKKRPLFGWGPGTFAVEYSQSFKSGQFREPVLQAHNLYLHRLVEEGAPALLFWLGTVLFPWLCGWKFVLRGLNAGAPQDEMAKDARARNLMSSYETENAPTDEAQLRELGAVFVAMIFAYGVCVVFVMPEQLPTMLVHFWGVVALLAALVWRNDGSEPRRAQRSILSRWLVRVVATTGVALFLWRAPYLWQNLRAHQLFDEALAMESAVDRIASLRQARDQNPLQPLYAAQLAQARWEVEGAQSARSIANLYRTAAHLSPDDGAWWHNIGVLSLLAGDADNAIRNATLAVRHDPTYSYYYATLADSYLLAGDARRAQSLRERARFFNSPPTVNDPLAPDRAAAEERYFCSILGARYRHAVTSCELIKQPGYTIEQALGEGYKPPPQNPEVP